MGFSASSGFGLLDVDLTVSTQVNAGANTTDTLTPPVGKVYEIIDVAILILAPVGDTSGTHQLEIRTMGGTSDTYDKIYCKGDHSTQLIVGRYCDLNGSSSELPASAREILQIIKGLLWCNNSNPLKLYYQNDTDANQTGTRTMKFLCRVYNDL